MGVEHLVEMLKKLRVCQRTQEPPGKGLLMDKAGTTGC